MISLSESKKMIQAINDETNRELGNVLFNKWLNIMNSKNLDSLVLGMCCLYCESIYARLYGFSKIFVHDLFISYKDGLDKSNLFNF